jgi:hypothetical protein
VAEILLFVHDFQLGTEISKQFIRFDKTVEFSDILPAVKSRIPNETSVVILDLDESDFNSADLISYIRNLRPNITIYGFKKTVSKRLHEELKTAGCDLIFPRSSFIKNLPVLIDRM